MNKTIQLNDLISWQGQYQENDKNVDSKRNPERNVPFPIEVDLNRKIFLWKGPIWRLDVDGIVNTTNEALSDMNPINNKIVEAAGEEIVLEYRQNGGCKTGEAKSTKSYQLPCGRVIHTVGPRYNVKYINAAANALHYCYRNCLSIAKEERLSSLAFCCIYTARQAYPREEASHIAIRTIRRLLEKWSEDFKAIVLCVENDNDLDIYHRILPLYFPRSPDEEEREHKELPCDLGNEFGEPVISDRKVRIKEFLGSENENPQLNNNQDVEDITEDLEEDKFGQMMVDPDVERLEKLREQSFNHVKSQYSQYRYQKYLLYGTQENFDHLRKIELIYKAGNDHDGDPVVTFIGSRLVLDDVDLEEVLIYIISELDNILEKKINFVYIHTATKDSNFPGLTWIQRLIQVLSSKYQKRLKRIYVLHPNMSIKMALWTLRPFLKNSFYNKWTWLHRISDLCSIAPPLKLPGHIQKYDGKNKINSSCIESNDAL